MRQRVGEVHDNDCPKRTPWEGIPVFHFGHRHDGDSTAKLRGLRRGMITEGGRSPLRFLQLRSDPFLQELTRFSVLESSSKASSDLTVRVALTCHVQIMNDFAVNCRLRHRKHSRGIGAAGCGWARSVYHFLSCTVNTRYRHTRY